MELDTGNRGGGQPTEGGSPPQDRPGRLRTPNIFYGWWIVASAFTINSLPFGCYWLGFSVFFLPISETLGIGRALASLPFTLRGVVAVVLSPVIGVLVDRMGPAIILIICAVLGGAGYVLLSFVDSYIMFMIVFLCVISVGMIPFDSPTTTVISRWFIRQRGRAMSVSYMGFPFGGVVLIPLMTLGVDHLGWRTTALVTGVVIAAITAPLATRLYRTPESRGLLPDGDTAAEGPVGADDQSFADTGDVEISTRRALTTAAYWMLSLSCGLRTTVFMALGIHLVGVMTWKGLDETTAGLIISAYAFMWMASTFVMGWAGDRWSKARIAATPAFLGTFAMVLLLVLDKVEVWQMVLLLMLWATNEGSWALNFSLLGDIFGRRNFGANRGAMLMVMHFMGLGAPFYSGWVFDKTGSYEWVLIPVASLLGVAGILNWFLPRFARSLQISSTAPGGRLEVSSSH